MEETNKTTGLAIAKNKSVFLESLFKGPRTFDGYVVRKLKHGIKLWILGEDYTLNREDVFALATKQSDGRIWYSYGGKVNERSMTEKANLADFIRSIA